MKNIQDKIRDFVGKHNLNHSPEISTLDLLSELGEVSKEILKSTDYGKKSFVPTEDLKLETGDTFYSFICLANALNIDLEEALNLVLEKYEKRLRGSGQAGSGR